MNEKLNKKKIEISVDSLVAFRDLISEIDHTNFDNIDVNSMSMCDYYRAIADAHMHDYSNFWIKVTCAFFALCTESGVPSVQDKETHDLRLDFDSLCK